MNSQGQLPGRSFWQARCGAWNCGGMPGGPPGEDFAPLPSHDCETAAPADDCGAGAPARAVTRASAAQPVVPGR